MNEKFRHIVDTPSLSVDSIIEHAMFHSKKEEARRFLNFMDNYVCYYLNRDGDELRFPILRIPACLSWAREVFVKYLIYRLSIYYNQDSMKDFAPKSSLRMMYVDPEDGRRAREARKHNKYVGKWNAYKREIQKLNSQHIYLGETGHKNLIFCTQSDLMVSRDDKNEFIEEFYGEPNDIFSKKNLSVCHDLTAKDIRHKIKEANAEVLIDNLFVFFTNNDECKSLRKANLDKLNQSRKTGIKNCFVFEFTDHPYRLSETLRRDKKLSLIYPGLGEKEYQYNEYFTSLTDKESKYLFLPTLESVGISEHIHVEDVEGLHETFFEPLIGSFTDNSEYWVQERNNFSLCLNPSLEEAYKQRLKGYTSDIDEHIYDESFEVQKGFAEKIRNELFTGLAKKEEAKRIALVVDYFLPENMKKELKKLLSPYRVRVYSYKHLTPSRNGKKRILGNKIKEEYVFVLRYRPHNARSAFSHYPNSFDPFTTNPGQRIIEIIQDYVFVDKYLWDKYDYELEEYKYLNSAYRREVLDAFTHPDKPDVSRITGEDELDEERFSSRQAVTTMNITYANGRSYRIAESEWIIYQMGDEDMGIARLKDLKEENLLEQLTAIQRLDDITNELSKTIIEKEQQYTERKRYTRNSCYAQGLITEEERDSDVYLWKILLAKKVEQKMQIQVYSEIMTPLKESDRVQFGAFTRWLDKNNPMMLPLQKATQKRLMEYLGLSPAYLQLMRSMKMSEVNKTRKNNNMLENFLADYLLNEIDADAFDEFKESKINEILQYERIDDLEALVELLNEKISLKNITSITI